jgi:hypothetical protein
MAVNNVRMFTGFPEKFNGGPRKKGVAHHVIIKAVDAMPIKKVILRSAVQ